MLCRGGYDLIKQVTHESFPLKGTNIGLEIIDYVYGMALVFNSK